MWNAMVIVLMVLVLAYNKTNQNDKCPCVNGGLCQPTYFESSCYCAINYIGKYCQTTAKILTENPEYADIDYKFTHFLFAPEAPNLFKFTFEACMLSNPEDLQSLIFITSDQDDGSPHYQPSIFSAAKIKVKEGTCVSFTSPYIEIRKNVEQPFWRIIIGIKAMPKAFRNIFYRTVLGKNHRPIQQEIIDQQPPLQKAYPQRIYFKVTYDVYKETLTEAIVRILIKVVIGAGILIALCLFSKIALFSYGIDTKGLFLFISRGIRKFWRKICPGREHERTYENYLKLRTSGAKEEAEGLRGEECTICLQPFESSDLIEQTICKHIYHESCLQAWSLKKQKCPLCRNQLKKSNQPWYSINYRA